MRSTLAAALAIAALALTACGKNNDAAQPAPAVTAQGAPNTSSAGMGVIGAIAGGGGNAAMNSYVADLQKMADAVAAVKDEPSARAAADAIDKLSPEMADYAKQLDGLSDSDKAAVVMAHVQELTAAQQKLATSMSGLGMNNPQLLQIIGDKVGKAPQMKSN